jgi:hypothetical protein
MKRYVEHRYQSALHSAVIRSKHRLNIMASDVREVRKGRVIKRVLGESPQQCTASVAAISD